LAISDLSAFGYIGSRWSLRITTTWHTTDVASYWIH